MERPGIEMKKCIHLFITIPILLALFNSCQAIGTPEIFGGASSKEGPSSDVYVPGPDTPPLVMDGNATFTNSVSPAFTRNCASCHALPFQGGTAPITIFNYTTMRNLIAQGPRATDNPLYNKIRNRSTHGSAVGDLCAGDINGSVSPCKELVEWTVKEFPLATDGMAGSLSGFDILGRMQGWALDPLNRTQKIQVLVYNGSVAAGGQLVATLTANQQGPGSVENGHYFNFEVPNNFKDGQTRNYYFYGVAATVENLLPGSPMITRAFQPNQAGRDFYTTNVRPRLNACAQCHQVTYDVHWFQLGFPTPGLGGTATNNQVINRMNGQDNHSGGSFCGGNKNNQPCLSIQQWWNLEFN